MVIHEMLHTLGLGENPPAPSEITRRVNDRCQWGQLANVGALVGAPFPLTRFNSPAQVISPFVTAT